MNPAHPDPARRIRAARDWLLAWAAVLAHPERHGYRERSIAWLVLALLLSFSVHLVLLSTLATVPRHYGQRLHLSLSARLAPAALEDAPTRIVEHPFPEFRATPAPAGTAGAAPTEKAPEPAAAEPATETRQALTLPEQYFRTRDLDSPAQPIGRAPLFYPEGAFHHRLRGVVRLRVFIGADGLVESLEVLSSAPQNVHFEEAAQNAMRMLRYTPGLKDGQPVRSQKVIEVTFDPDEVPRR